MKTNFVFIIVVLSALASCDIEKEPLQKKVNPRIELISSTDWYYWSHYKFETHYRGSKSFLQDDTLSIQLVDSTTGKFQDRSYRWAFAVNDTSYSFHIVGVDTPWFNITDSGKYEIFNYRGREVLLLADRFFVSTPIEEGIQLPDSLYDMYEKLKVGGYSVGDVIDLNLVNIVDVKEYHSPPREIAQLKSNHDITYDLIMDSLIVEINREAIPNTDIKSVINVISGKTAREADYDAPDTSVNSRSDYVYISESYNWNEDVRYSIQLRRSDMIWDRDSDSYRLLLKRGPILWGNWELNIQSYFLERIIELIYSSPESIDGPKSLYVE